MGVIKQMQGWFRRKTRRVIVEKLPKPGAPARITTYETPVKQRAGESFEDYIIRVRCHPRSVIVSDVNRE